MTRQRALTCMLVEFIPEHLEGGVLYVSQEYGTAAHSCCCGCGSKVTTALSPTDWTFALEGQGPTLYPSVGNWGLLCRSHYWIRRGRVVWAGNMSQKEIQRRRRYDREAKRQYFAQQDAEIGIRRAVTKAWRTFLTWLNNRFS